jgi:Flp pilus assembly protein TadB
LTVHTLPSQSPPRVVDLNALKTNQAVIVATVVVAFVLGSEIGQWLIAALALSMAIGVIWPGYGPIQLFYRYGLRDTGVVKPATRPDEPAPHRFAQTLGEVSLSISTILLFAGATTIGWIIAWIVLALALTNLVFGFCAGCFIFLQLRRIGVAR